MKFARYLEENVVVEWRRAYIKYRGLKKLIKRVDARRTARLNRDLARFASKSSSKRNIVSTFDGLRKRPRPRDRDQEGSGSNDSSFLNTGSQKTLYGGLSEDEEDNTLPHVTLEGTGLALASTDNDDDVRRKFDLHTRGTDIDTTKASFGEEATGSKRESPNVDVEATANSLPKMKPSKSATVSHDENIKILSGFAGPSEDTRGGHKGKGGKKAKRKTSKMMNYETILAENFDEEERYFFGALDNELERIVAFYEARESDMAKRYEMLARQLQELADHRKEYKAAYPPQETWSDVGNRFSLFVQHPISQPAQALKRPMSRLTRRSADVPRPTSNAASDPVNKATTDGKEKSTSLQVDEGDKRRTLALSRMLNSAGGTLTEAEDEELRRSNKDAAMSHDPERYRAARKKLKAAVLEYYRGLEILKNYKVLNRTGFAKILKKFEKTTEVHCADAYYNAKVAPSVLVSSESVERLLKGTEEIFTAYFEHGNRKKALERLRINSSGGTAENTSTHHFSVARSGFYLGIAMCATIGGLINALTPNKRMDIPQWQSLLRVYGAEFIPTFFAFLFGINLAVWHRARVNSVFIFEWDVRHALEFHQYFEIPSFFLLLLSLAFWVSFLDPFPDAIAPTTWPIVWLIVVIIFLLDPLPITHYYSRRWIIISLARVFQGGVLFAVEFRDFFLGDELNSVNWSLSTLWYIGCEYNTSWAYPDQCDPNQTFWTPVLLSLPALMRFVQCFRRYKDSKYTANLHLINAGKYTSSIFNYFFYFNYRYHGSHRTQDVALWCVFGSIYSIYTSTWDITMDWSLLRRHARYPWLRDELVFESYWPFYYWAIVTNVILRFGWIIYLLPGSSSSLTRIFVIAFLEMLRRFQWNFLRLENEHLGNVDMYRVSREIPLPYRFKPSKEEEEETDDDGFKKPAIGPKSLFRLRTAVARRYHSEPSRNVDTNKDQDVQEGIYSPESPHSKDHDKVIEDGETSIIDHAIRNRDNKGKQRDSSGEEDLTTRQRIARKVRDHLVPDRGNFHRKGDAQIDDVGAAHGASARDYEPRRLEPDGDTHSGLETSDEEEDHHHHDQTTTEIKPADGL